MFGWSNQPPKIQPLRVRIPTPAAQVTIRTSTALGRKDEYDQFFGDLLVNEMGPGTPDAPPPGTPSSTPTQPPPA